MTVDSLDFETPAERTRCESCDMAILIAFSASTGRKIPLDDEPTRDGQYSLEGRIATVVSKRNRGPHDQLYRCHYGTCPHAAHARAKAGRS